MSIYPPGGRYVYAFTIQYAKQFSRPMAFQDTLHHNRVFRTEPVSNKFYKNQISTWIQTQIKLEFKPKFKPETRARASHDEPARSSFDSEP